MTDQPHLDDEALSAVLDGEGAAHEAAHVDACDDCGARLEVLRSASLLVRTPVAPAGDAAREAAVAAALATVSAPIPLRRRRPAPVWLAAAAVVAVLAIGAVVLAGRDDTSSGSNDLASERTTAPEGGASAAAPAPFATNGPVDGGDLGAVDLRALPATIDQALGSREAADAAGDSKATAGIAAADCESSVRDGNPELGPLLYRARGAFDGVAVTVLAFDAAGRRWVYVVGDDDCGIKNQTTYSPSAAP
jgi:hypothetical protein